MALVVPAGIVGSVNVELEKSYRVMLLKIANELSLDDCQQIAFVAGLAAPTCHPEPGKPSIRLHLMSTLESLGHVSPLKLDFLEELIDAIGKKYLLEIVQGYKKNPLYKEAMRRLDEQDKKKKKGKKCKQQTSAAAEYSPKQLVASVKNSTEKKHRLQESYATLLTQFSQVALLMRNALESDDPARIEQTFLSVASDGDAIARTLRKNLEEAGLKCECGDEESSGGDSQDNSPTDEERNLEASFSPHPPVRVESLNPQRHEWSTPEASPSPTHTKKPTPLPRKKRLQQTPTQVSSPGSSLSTSSTTHHFVFCQQETQGPPSLAATFHIPQSVSTSCLTASAEYSGDYSGGTGDSGVGDIRHKYTPSQEALDQLDPRQHQRSKQDQKESSTDEQSRSRYMKLKTREEKCPEGYTKPLRARSLDDFLSMKDEHW